MKRIVAFISIPFLIGCSKNLSCSEYVAYTKNKHHEFEVESGSDIGYKLTYVPVEKLIAENVLANDSLKQEFKEDLKKMSENTSSSFQLTITTKTGNLFTQDAAPKAEQARYYSVEFKHAINAVNTVNDTIPCLGYLFQPNGGFGNQAYFEFDFAVPVDHIKEVLITSRYLSDSAVSLNISGLHHEYPKLKIK